MTVQTEKPLELLAQLDEIESTRHLIILIKKNFFFILRSLKVPNIYPITPTVDLKLSNIYNDTTILPRHSYTNLNINTIFFSKTPIQKYPWTT